ncbi:hypothetical protein NQ317_019775, partial [Molorchus minor]
DETNDAVDADDTNKKICSLKWTPNNTTQTWARSTSRLDFACLTAMTAYFHTNPEKCPVMFLLILTLTLCLTNAFVYTNIENTSSPSSSDIEPIYNINDWVEKLQLERCALVAIGLRYFAVFVEDEILGDGEKVVEHRKYFLGICQQSTLEEWTFFARRLWPRRGKNKCRFKLSSAKYEARVHRRFCDISLMINNKDCQCDSTILGDEMVKVKGFPTCYMSPLSTNLCKYNVCGMYKCKATTIEDTVYSVECSTKCKGKDSFCEYPLDGTSMFPVSRSFWSKWQKDTSTESMGATGRTHYIASCINSIREERRRLSGTRDWLVDTNNQTDEDIEDDDDNPDVDEDIVLEENTDEEVTITTTEEMEKRRGGEGVTS